MGAPKKLTLRCRWNKEGEPTIFDPSAPEVEYVRADIVAAMSTTINEATANLMQVWDMNMTFVDLQQMTAVIASRLAEKDAEIKGLRELLNGDLALCPDPAEVETCKCRRDHGRKMNIGTGEQWCSGCGLPITSKPGRE